MTTANWQDSWWLHNLMHTHYLLAIKISSSNYIFSHSCCLSLDVSELASASSMSYLYGQSSTTLSWQDAGQRHHSIQVPVRTDNEVNHDAGGENSKSNSTCACVRDRAHAFSGH